MRLFGSPDGVVYAKRADEEGIDVTVINHNGHCKPKFILWFQVRSFVLQPVL